MEAIRDLIHEKQVNIFDALDELSDPRIGIKTPQLIVVGDQSSGKSSLLEAIAHFHFPVRRGLCTQFPTKLIFRRSIGNHESVHLSIDPSASRTEEEKRDLLSFHEVLPSMESISEYMGKAATKLKINTKISDHRTSDNLENGAQTLKIFAQDTLRVEINGPNLPLLSLVDLPGLYQAASVDQDEASRELVQQIVEDHIKTSRAIILLVVTARTPFNNSWSLSTIHKLQKQDPGLADRIVGVITNPDEPSSLQEIYDMLNGRFHPINFKYGWHVVRNQDEKADERKAGLAKRDESEDNFFQAQEWSRVDSNRKGIRELRNTLRNVLWNITCNELPAVIREVEAKIAALSARVKSFGQSRATDEGRRRFLSDIAQNFERLMREACRGSNYQNEPCMNLHRTRVDSTCNACNFFPPFDDDRGDTGSQSKRLRANVRHLNEKFASAMRKYGRTQVFDDSGISHFPEQNKGPSSFRILDDLSELYVHDKPKIISRKAYGEWLSLQLEQWRGLEPPGEVSSGAYAGLLEHQTRKWESIATAHHDAVWKTVRNFVHLALNATCAESEVLLGLKNELVEPRLEKLQESSFHTLLDLLDCRGRGKTGFYDSLVPMIQEKQQAGEKLTDRLVDLVSDGWNAINEENKAGMADIIQNMARDLLAQRTWGLSTYFFNNKKVQHNLSRILDQIIAQAFTEDDRFNHGRESQASLRRTQRRNSVRYEESDIGSRTRSPPDHDVEDTERGDSNDDDIDSVNSSEPDDDVNPATSRALEHVEAFYETVMVSFIGFVNALVIEKGILDKLPHAILTQELIREEDKSVIMNIADERENVVRQRKEDEELLDNLYRVLKSLKKTRCS